MKPLPELDLNPYPELEPAAFGRGWWHYSDARTAERDAAYLESARGLQGFGRGLWGLLQRILHGRRRWKPPRVDAQTYLVESAV